jgi:hypothetical protein
LVEFVQADYYVTEDDALATVEVKMTGKTEIDVVVRFVSILSLNYVKA